MANTFYLAADLERCVAFYRDAVGLTVKKQTAEWVEFEVRGATLAFMKGKPGRLWSGGRGGAEVTLIVDDMGETLRTFRTRGVSGLGVLQERPHGWVVSLDDPDGNRLYLLEQVPGR